MLKYRPQERVIHHHERLRRMLFRGLGGGADIGHDQRRIGRGLDKYDARIVRCANGRADAFRIAGRHRNAANAERIEKLVDQGGRSTVERHCIDDARTGPGEGEERRHDGRHAGVEYQRVFRTGLERH